jgi:hypothetical protein
VRSTPTIIVKPAAADFFSRTDKLNILIHNAVVSLTEEAMTTNGFEMVHDIDFTKEGYNKWAAYE